jgi:hypothetical protein
MEIMNFTNYCIYLLKINKVSCNSFVFDIYHNYFKFLFSTFAIQPIPTQRGNSSVSTS